MPKQSFAKTSMRKSFNEVEHISPRVPIHEQSKGGVKTMKQDLQEKINNYQNILRKTYGRANAHTLQIQSKETDDSIENLEDSSLFSQNTNKVPCHAKSFANISSINNCDSFDNTNKSANWSKPPTNLPQNLENIKQAYYSKMQALT